jgi:small-conductance mechanosensitive channel
MEVVMDKTDCAKEKISSRTVGLILLPFAFLIAFAGFMVIPVLGVIFALPVAGLAIMLIAAPQSKVCRLITEKIG